MLKEYNIIPKILTIISNVNHIHYSSFAEHLDNITKKQDKIIVRFIIDNNLKKPKNLIQKFHFFNGQENVKKLYYERNLFFNKKAKLLFEKTKKGFKLIVNNDYYKYVRFRIDNVFPPGVHLTDIITYELIKNNFLPIYAAAISKNGFTNIIFAPPDTGKSLTTLLALKRGYEFVSEDVAVIDKNYIYSCPFTYTYRHLIKKRKCNFLNLNIFYYFFKKPKPKILLTDYKIRNISKPKNIFILNRGCNSIEKISKSKAFRKLMLLNKAQFKYKENPLFIAFEYFNRKSVNSKSLISKEEKLIKNLLKNVNIFLIKTKYPKNYLNLIERCKDFERN